MEGKDDKGVSAVQVLLGGEIQKLEWVEEVVTMERKDYERAKEGIRLGVSDGLVCVRVEVGDEKRGEEKDKEVAMKGEMCGLKVTMEVFFFFSLHFHHVLTS